MRMKSLLTYFLKYITESRNKKTEQEQEEHIEGISILDKIATVKDEEEQEQLVKDFADDFAKPNGPTIYAFITDKVQDAIKVGYTDQHPEKRIAQWKDIYGKEAGEVTCLGYWSSEEFNAAGERVFFWDHAIHKKISDRRYKQLDKDEFMATLTDEGKKIADLHFSREFFRKYKHILNHPEQLDPEDKEELSAKMLEDIIKLMKLNIRKGTQDFKLYSFDEEGKTSNKQASDVWKSPANYDNTDLQNEAIKNGVDAIKDDKKNILMAAVMRFGKTHATYEIIKDAGLKKVIVCSAKADVRKSWRDDINHVKFYKDFVFIEVYDQYKWDITHCKDDKLVTEHVNVYDNILEPYKDKTQIFFFTLHDLGGSIKGMKEKHKKLFDEEFDMMVVDETHYGSHANTFGDVTHLASKKIDDETNNDVKDEQEINKIAQKELEKLNIKYKRILQVSGTPYYILASNEMIDKDAAIISKVSYSDMLKARDKWVKDHPEEDQSDSPYFGIPTLHKIGLRLNKECRKRLAKEGVSTSISALFKVKGNKFVYEKEVESLMKSIFGDGKANTLAFLKNKKVEGNKICKHTMIVLPEIKAAEAMKDLLDKIIDTKEREVFCIVGHNKFAKNGAGELNDKLLELDNKGKKSIVITVMRFLTGVSMPCIDSMIYLKNASSPQEYDQNIFRLCTRYVKDVKGADSESRSKKVNMKDNVYLIDFNIANMFNMIANSAKMKAAADGDPRPETIKKYMKDDLETTPIFCEDGKGAEIAGKMEKVNPKDLMEIYTGYNKNKSIADIVNDEIGLFDKMFMKKNFQDIIAEINIEGDKSKNSVGNVNDEGDADIEATGNGTKEKEFKSVSDYIKDGGDKKAFQLTKEKFKAITKNLLYCNICLDEPCLDIEHIIEKAKKDKEFEKMLKEFKIQINDLKKAYNMMGIEYKEAYDSLIYRMSMYAQDSSIDGMEKFTKALKGLGRLGKSEVVTPDEIVEKMIDKLDKEDYEKANSILIVNDKQAEFLMGIYKKFGKKITEKCKVIPSSEIGKYLCKKMAKSIKIKDIENTILNIKDVDGNGYYDVNDFLNMKNEEVLEMNNGKKFDIVLMNPPYSKGLHLKFLEKVIQISDQVVSIQPISWLQQGNKFNSKSTYYKYEDSISKHIKDLEIINSEKAKKDFNIIIDDIGIYICDKNGGYKYNEISNNSIIKKVMDYIKENLCNIESNKKDGYRVRIPKMAGVHAGGSGIRKPQLAGLYIKDIIFKDGKKDGKWWYEYYVKNQNSKKTEEITSSIKFDTEEEAQNFINSLYTDFIRYCNEFIYINAAVNNKRILWMGNAKHPRTGKIGYKSEWTNEDFNIFFNLSKEEIKQYKDYIKEFEEKRNEWIKNNK